VTVTIANRTACSSATPARSNRNHSPAEAKMSRRSFSCVIHTVPDSTNTSAPRALLTPTTSRPSSRTPSATTRVSKGSVQSLRSMTISLDD
jgi:hypothetical protein